MSLLPTSSSLLKALMDVSIRSVSVTTLVASTLSAQSVDKPYAAHISLPAVRALSKFTKKVSMFLIDPLRQEVPCRAFHLLSLSNSLRSPRQLLRARQRCILSFPFLDSFRHKVYRLQLCHSQAIRRDQPKHAR
jgi:hypothetical protein